MDCRVVVEAAVSVYDVETVDEAVRIAISKTGELLNPDLNYVEIDMGSPTGADGEELPAAYIVADEALVALELTMDVFNVEQEEHARRVARTLGVDDGRIQRRTGRTRPAGRPHGDRPAADGDSAGCDRS